MEFWSSFGFQFLFLVLLFRVVVDGFNHCHLPCYRYMFGINIISVPSSISAGVKFHTNMSSKRKIENHNIVIFSGSV